MKPKILIATTFRWFTTARLVMAFANAGCVVETVHPAGHLLDELKLVTKSYPYSGLTPLGSLRDALELSRPDLVIPGDDVAMLHLHRLCEQLRRESSEDAQRVRAVLEHSLGNAAMYPLIESRNEMAALARSEGIATPETDCVFTEEQVTRWMEERGAPAVLKADGTSGGEGVKIVRTVEEALRAFRTLRAPLATMVVAKRACIDHEMHWVTPWLQRRKRSVSIQTFVRGRDANLAIACWQGKIVASISAEVLRTAKPKGPASLVRVLPEGEMLRAAEKMVARLNLSGLCGMDFMMDDQTGKSYFIELNARATQTCHLALGEGRNPVAALYAKLADVPVPEVPAVTTNEMIAFFPSAWQSNPGCEFFRAAYHDVPWEEPGLVRAGVAKPSRFTYEAWQEFWSKLSMRRNKEVRLGREL